MVRHKHISANQSPMIFMQWCQNQGTCSEMVPTSPAQVLCQCQIFLEKWTLMGAPASRLAQWPTSWTQTPTQPAIQELMYSNERALCGIVNYEEAFNQCSPTGKFIQKKIYNWQKSFILCSKLWALQNNKLVF